ncbi:class III signal peptide-containing protein [archaeon]|nr:class III signal peptide-containing protein [archaeon]
MQKCCLVSEEKAQISLEYLLIIAAVITLIVVVSLFIKGSLLRQWIGLGRESTGAGLNTTA